MQCRTVHYCGVEWASFVGIERGEGWTLCSGSALLLNFVWGWGRDVKLADHILPVKSAAAVLGGGIAKPSCVWPHCGDTQRCQLSTLVLGQDYVSVGWGELTFK